MPGTPLSPEDPGQRSLLGGLSQCTRVFSSPFPPCPLYPHLSVTSCCPFICKFLSPPHPPPGPHWPLRPWSSWGSQASVLQNRWGTGCSGYGPGFYVNGMVFLLTSCSWTHCITARASLSSSASSGPPGSLGGSSEIVPVDCLPEGLAHGICLIRVGCWGP